MSASTKSVKPFGEWKTPISSAIATAKASRFQDLVLDATDNGNDVVYWSEIRFDEGGRTVVSSCEVGKSEPKDWTPAGFSARTTVHEYGGGNIFVQKGNLYFSNFSDQRLYKQLAPDSTPTPVTAADTSYRYANGHMSAKTNLIYIIREDHKPTNSVICLDPSTQQEKVLACGADFYSTPKVSLDGEKICWVQWFHPSMPWYDTELWTAKLTKSGDAIIEGSAKKIAGGKDVSVMIPRWTPSGELRFISDENNWWNVYESALDGSITNIYKMDQEVGQPAWLLVISHMIPTLLALEKKDFQHRFYFSSATELLKSGRVYCFAHSAIQVSTLISVNILDGKVEILRKSQQVDIDEGYLSKFTEICYNTTDGGKSYANYYKPTNKDYEGPDGELPPLLVKAHGGPTSSATTSLQLPIQYFTSRGFAVLDVNYRGSTGYGREYRLKLADKWGIYDVEDCCAAAQHLADNKLVDKNKLCIDGGSAGGYTTLACLAFKDVFKAGQL
ncbi:hypothetical protein EB796_016729 [Bugula neritina]|uniref:Peptidase S9 prolyl oligopeptidase catalytic domain-containing protein n=1 Tax=Bugula neritina TaxID=10212 RepID=A0A7J7JHA2_BUGNE|nr:hypothetical protein EB796_016729 [Bugula neritina]